MEMINSRIEELEEKLNNTVAGSKEAMALVEELDRFYQMRLREEKAIDERSDRNRQFDLQERKYEAEIREELKEEKNLIMRSILDCIVKPVIGGAVAIGSIAVIGAIEEKTILGQKMMNIAMRVFPKLF